MEEWILRVFFMGSGTLACKVWLHLRWDWWFWGDHLVSVHSIPLNDMHETIKRHRPDIGVSVGYRHILAQETIDLFPRLINLHTSLLPWNRGVHPNVWSIIDDTPAGVSIHELDAGIDTGPVFVQKEVERFQTDTGETLWKRLQDAALDLFVENWEDISRGKLKAREQESKGTFYQKKDLSALDVIKEHEVYPAGYLLDILRARTFPPHKGVCVEREGKLIQVRVELEEIGRN